jgi:hypothetical protein
LLFIDSNVTTTKLGISFSEHCPKKSDIPPDPFVHLK